MAAFRPSSCGRNLGYGLRYRLGYKGPAVVEKYEPYQCTV
jgi:hypothetical protein